MKKPDWKVIPLIDALRPLWTETRAGMQWAQPAFTYLQMSMMNRDHGESVLWWTDDCPTMAVDGKRMWANPTYFLTKLSPKQRVAGGVHETLHAVFRHVDQAWWHQTYNQPVVWNNVELPYDHKTANWAQDFVINAYIKAGNIGELHPDWLYSDRFKCTMTWQEVYHLIYDAMNDRQGGGSKPDAECLKGLGLPPNMGQQDEHLPPGTSDGKDPAEAVADNSDLEWKQAIKGALAVGEKAGRLPAEIERLFGEMVEPVVPWQDKVLGFLSRNTGGGGYNFRRADRRLIVRNIYAPQRSGKGCGTLVLGADSSGSIYGKPKLVDYLISEIGGVLDQLKPRQLLVLWCDAKVQRVDRLHDTTDIEVMRKQGAKGGGGTSFVPVFDWIEKEGIDPDALIYLTDLEGTFPDKAPAYPTIWGNFGRKATTAPFGEVVHIERPN